MPPIDKRKPVLVPEQNTPDKPLLLLLPPLEKTLYGRGYVCITLCVCVCVLEKVVVRVVWHMRWITMYFVVSDASYNTPLWFFSCFCVSYLEGWWCVMVWRERESDNVVVVAASSMCYDGSLVWFGLKVQCLWCPLFKGLALANGG